MTAASDTRLREVRSTDLGAITRWRNERNVWRGALGRRFPITEVNTDQWFAGLGQGAFPTHIVWAVADADDDIVGLVHLAEVHWIHRTAEFGIWICPEHQGAGHGRRATVAAVAAAFGDFGLRQLRLRVLAGHDRAISIYEQAGFVTEGQLRGAVLDEGAVSDLVVMRCDRPGG